MILENLTQLALEYDDVLIRQLPSDVTSRDYVDIGVDFEDFTLKFPLLASPMVGVVDGVFAKALSDLGGLAFLHRFYTNRAGLITDVSKNLNIHKDNFGLSVGVGEENFEELLDLNPKILLVDTANGGLTSLVRYVNKISDYVYENNFKTIIMAGNTSTHKTTKALADAGATLIRVGIGSGSPCSTRNVTGIGFPMITSLQECSASGYNIVADGGIKNSGDFVKAIVAGATLGMAGNLFARCYEAPHKGVYMGMASKAHMQERSISVKSIEGFSMNIEKEYSLADFVNSFSYGIKSAGTYLNALNLDEINANGKFIRVTDSAIKKGI